MALSIHAADKSLHPESTTSLHRMFGTYRWFFPWNCQMLFSNRSTLLSWCWLWDISMPGIQPDIHWVSSCLLHLLPQVSWTWRPSLGWVSEPKLSSWYWWLSNHDRIPKAREQAVSCLLSSQIFNNISIPVHELCRKPSCFIRGKESPMLLESAYANAVSSRAIDSSPCLGTGTL
jgi:hypothetical protein